MKKFLVLFLIISSLFIIFYWRNSVNNNQVSVEIKPQLEDSEVATIAPVTIPTEIIRKDEIKSIFFNVPFTPQAPFADWSDPRQQDGCEEAVALMAVRWAKNEKLTKEEGLREIIAASTYQSDKYGEYRDTSLEDTVERIIKGYFDYPGAEVKKVFSAEDIIYELMENHLVLVPLNGQILNNPYFTWPGPERHMVAIRGYDHKTNEFITNDPGTGRGEEYRYPVEVIFNAIREYSSGYHVPITEIEKSMIVIRVL